MRYDNPEKTSLWVREGRSGGIHPKVRLKPEDRIKDMDAIGTDLQVVSVHTQIFGYHLSPQDGLAQAREINNEIAGMAHDRPDRFAGMATLPMQDPKAAIAELDANTLADRGVIIAGDPESCIKPIQMYDEIGVDQVMMIMQTETIPHEKVMSSIEMFGKHVFPIFRQAEKVKAGAVS